LDPHAAWVVAGGRVCKIEVEKRVGRKGSKKGFNRVNSVVHPP